MRMGRVQLIAGLVLAVAVTIAHAQVPKPTINIVGTYYYDQPTGYLYLSALTVTQVQYLDGTTSSTDAISGATFDITGLTFTGMEDGDALFTDGTIVVSNDTVTFFTADLVNVRLTEVGFGDFGNMNVGFNDTNVTNLVFTSGTGSQFVDEFALLITPPDVPDQGSVQLEMTLLYPFGPAPTTFEENFGVSSYGNVLGVFDGAPADECPTDPNKTQPGQCGCGTPDTDSDSDGAADCLDGCPNDADKTNPGVCGCGVSDDDNDGDGTPDCIDGCPNDSSKIDPGICGCGVADTDSDGDGTPDCIDNCPADPNKTEPGLCGCGISDDDTDGDGTPNCHDLCPTDPNKVEPGLCVCGVLDTDSDGDDTPDCHDLCPTDPNKTEPGQCDCGVADTDGDGDGTPDCIDQCPADPNKTEPGQCDCGEADTDSDADGTADCNDGCPNDADKLEPGQCGCGVADTDSDADGTADCNDACPDDAGKIEPGQCGCGVPDTDSDGDGVADCNDRCAGEPDIDSDGDGVLNCEDGCPADPNKLEPGQCGCGAPDTDGDGDGTADCNDACPSDPNKIDPGICGCGVADTDSDGDGTADCNDGCPNDANKTEPGQCGCGALDTDSDGDGTADCNDGCPDDPNKLVPGICGCGVADTNSDGDGAADCIDECPDDPNKTSAGQCGCGNAETGDSDGDGTLDCIDGCPNDPNKIEPGPCGCGVAETDIDSDGVLDCLCNLSVTVDACAVPPAPAISTDCQGKVINMTLEYLGGGCEASNHNQDSKKVRCSGGAGTVEPVRIVVSDKKGGKGWSFSKGKQKARGKKVYAAVDDVLLGDLIEVDAANAGRKTMKSNTHVRIYNMADELIEDVRFHTSCSQPLNVGDQFGSVRIVAMTTTKGGTVTLPPEDEEIECMTEIARTPPPHCEGKVKVLELRYTGGGCDDTNHTQSPDKVSCSLNAGITSPVRIIAGDGGIIWLDTGLPASVALGDRIEIAAQNAGRNELTSSTTVKIFDINNELIEQVRFHTSCSQPLNLGDQFGSLEVFAMQTTNGGFDSLGADVDYTYTITNNGIIPLENVLVMDDLFGSVPGSPITLIEPGQTVTLGLQAFLWEETTNNVVVASNLGPDGLCEEAATMTVTVEELPPPAIVCTSRVQSMLLKYTGPTILGATVRVVTDNGVGSVIKKCEVDDVNKHETEHTVVYENIDLISGETLLSSPDENGWTIDATARCRTQLGANTWIYLNDVEEEIHTSCSAPFVSLAPAPLNQPKGAPSPNWYVMDFAQK